MMQEGRHEYEESTDSPEVVAGKALALLLSRTERLNAEESAGSDVEDQIRRNVETIVNGYAALVRR